MKRSNSTLFQRVFQREVQTSLVILTSLFCFSALAEPSPQIDPPAKDQNHYFYICKNQKVVRTLRMDKMPSSCKAIYTKDGVDKVIGSAQKLFSCVDVLEGVKKTLLGAGWKCKEVKGEQISQDAESTAPEATKK